MTGQRVRWADLARQVTAAADVSFFSVAFSPCKGGATSVSGIERSSGTALRVQPQPTADYQHEVAISP